MAAAKCCAAFLHALCREAVCAGAAAEKRIARFRQLRRASATSRRTAAQPPRTPPHQRFFPRRLLSVNGQPPRFALRHHAEPPVVLRAALSCCAAGAAATLRTTAFACHARCRPVHALSACRVIIFTISPLSPRPPELLAAAMPPRRIHATRKGAHAHQADVFFQNGAAA